MTSFWMDMYIIIEDAINEQFAIGIIKTAMQFKMHGCFYYA